MNQTTDDILAALEAKLPSFTWSCTTFGAGMPVFFSWDHRHHAYGPLEGQRMQFRGGTFPSFKAALQGCLARYEGFEKELEATRQKEKARWDKQKAALQDVARQRHMAEKKARRQNDPEPEVDEGDEVAEAEKLPEKPAVEKP